MNIKKKAFEEIIRSLVRIRRDYRYDGKQSNDSKRYRAARMKANKRKKREKYH